MKDLPEKLNSFQINELKNRYPDFEMSYESDFNNSIDEEKYNLIFAVPTGKKYMIWFTFYKLNDVVIIMELNKEKKIIHADVYKNTYDVKLHYNTIFYGTMLEKDEIKNTESCFIIENVYYYEGLNMKSMNLNQKYYYLQNFFKNENHVKGIIFAMPNYWKTKEFEMSLLVGVKYHVHHLQYRSSESILPYLNVVNKIFKEKKNTNKLDSCNEVYVPYYSNSKKPQYKMKTIFIVKADVQGDIYRLYAYGKNNSLIYYNTAYIGSYKKSVYMNNIFRIMKENKNLDYIELSDDEDDFQNVDPNKYLIKNKKVQMECEYNEKFRRWVPLNMVDHKRVVHISQL